MGLIQTEVGLTPALALVYCLAWPL